MAPPDEPAASPPPPHPPSSADAATLRLTLPRRELYGVSGMVTRVDIFILEYLADEAYWSDAAALAGNDDVKEVRVGLILRSGRQVLVSNDGVLLHIAPVSPAACHLGENLLRSLRDFVRIAGEMLVGSKSAGIQLLGYLNEDVLPESRPYFILCYEMRLPGDGPAPAAPSGMTWIDLGDLAHEPLEPVSILVGDALVPPAKGPPLSDGSGVVA